MTKKFCIPLDNVPKMPLTPRLTGFGVGPRGFFEFPEGNWGSQLLKCGNI